MYVKTRQQEFNYPQGQTNSLTSYEAAADRGAKLIRTRSLQDN
ncbi:hypothetical protein [Edaphobacter aggregans]|nr:hypothetical protein [Edaphobacter aggregans]